MDELFGGEVPRKVAREFGDRVVTEIVNRTLGGVDRSGNDFVEYSKEYAKEKGVARGSVDMWLKGDMLPSINHTAKQDGTVKVEVTGKKNKLKSYNHNIGDTLPKRSFFGVKKTDLQRIANEVKSDLGFKPKKQESASQTIGDIFDAIDALSGESV